MKLSKNEKVILLVFLVILIIVFSVIVFLMPEFNKIAPNNEALDAAKAKRDGIYASLSREATIDDELEEAKKSAEDHTKYFYDDKFTNHDLDVFTREILSANDMEVVSLQIAPYTTTSLELMDYIEVPVVYPIKVSADIINGTDYTEYVWTQEYDEKGEPIKPTPDQYFTYLRTHTQTVGVHGVTVTVKGERQDFVALFDYIKDLPMATYVAAASIPYTGKEQNVDAEGVTKIEEVELKDTSEIVQTITISFYCTETVEASESSEE